MKILLTVHCFYPTHIFGTETLTLEIAKTLKSMGHEVCVLTADSHTEPANGGDYVKYLYESIPVISIDTSKNPNRTFKDTYYKKENAEIIKNIIREYNPDIIHCIHTINLTVSFLEIIKDMGIPAIMTMTDFFGICFNCKLQKYDNSFCSGPDAAAANCVECYFAATKSLITLRNKSGFVGKIISSPKVFAKISKVPLMKKVPVIKEASYVTQRNSIIKKQYEIFSRLIAPTDFLRKSYINNGYPAEKFEKLTFGLNMQPFEGYTEPRKEFKKNLTFGYIGQLYWHKGVDLLISAFNKLNNPELKLKIYGDMTQDTNYTDKLKELIGSNSNINLLGTFPRTEQGRILKDIDVLVIPSLWYENSPLVLLGALATRTPVIVSDVDGMNEFVKNDYNGFLFKPGDIEELYNQLKKCVDNPDSLISISKNANYDKSIKRNVEEYIKIYEQCLEV